MVGKIGLLWIKIYDSYDVFFLIFPCGADRMDQCVWMDNAYSFTFWDKMTEKIIDVTWKWILIRF